MDLSIKNNQNNVHFTALHLQKSRMNRTQKLMSEVLADAINCCDSYQPFAKKEVNAVIMPANDPNGIKVRYMDVPSWSFVKKDENNFLEREVNNKNYKEIFDIADQVISDLKQILTGEIARPKINIEKIVAGDTDLARLDKEEFLDIKRCISEWKSIGLVPEDAKNAAVRGYIDSYVSYDKIL